MDNDGIKTTYSQFQKLVAELACFDTHSERVLYTDVRRLVELATVCWSAFMNPQVRSLLHYRTTYCILHVHCTQSLKYLTLPNSDLGCKAALPKVLMGNVGNTEKFCAFTMAWKMLSLHFRGFRFNTITT